MTKQTAREFVISTVKTNNKTIMEPIVLGTNKPTESGYYLNKDNKGKIRLLYFGISNGSSGLFNLPYKEGLSTTMKNELTETNINIPVEWMTGLFSNRLEII